MNKRIFWILIFMFLFVSSAFCAPGHSRNVRANNNGTNGQILINTGQDSGKTDIGSWTDIDSFGFVSSDDLTKEIKERIDGDKNLQTQIENETENRKVDITSLQSALNAEADVRYSTDCALQTNISNEQTRALIAEGNLQANINQTNINSINRDSSLRNDLTAETLNRIGTDTILQKNIDIEALNRFNADSILQRNINNTNTRIDEVNNRVSKLERTQFKVQTEFRIIDTKTFSVSPYVSSNFTRNCVDEAGLRIVFKIGKSYEEREIDKLREKIRQKEDEEISNRATIAEMNSRLNYLMKKVK